MTLESKVWETIKAEYLSKVKKALSLVKYPHMSEVIEDVQSHMDQRFSELKSDEQTNKNIENIIAEMGPASDYAELLAPNTAQLNRKNRQKFLLLVSLAVVIIAGVVLLPMVLPKTAGYIVKFEPVDGFQPRAAKELLEAFNNEVKFRVTTHHFRTEVQKNKLIGYICTDTKVDKRAIATILSDSKQLKLISIKPVTSKGLEKHYTRGQPSLQKADAEE